MPRFCGILEVGHAPVAGRLAFNGLYYLSLSCQCYYSRHPELGPQVTDDMR